MSHKTAIIAYNPKSGSFNQARLDQLSAAFLAAGYACKLSDSYSDELIELASTATHICVVGGDGTLRDVAARLINIAGLPPISVYPAGTINLVARELSYPRNIRKFVARVVGGHAPRQLHLSDINSQPMLVCASIGPDSLAVAAVSTELKQRIGRYAYAVELSKLLLRWPRHNLSVRADGTTYNCEAAFVLNGRYFAGPWRLSKKADMAVPTIELLLLPRARRRDYLRLIFSVTAIPALASKAWVRVSATSAELSGNSPLPVQVDGDIAAILPVTIAINGQQMLFA